MSFDDFYKRFVAFGLAFAFSLFVAAFLYKTNFSDIFKKESKPAPKIVASKNNGMGTAACNPTSEKKDFPVKPAEIRAEKATGIRIISKPRANYTNEARTNYVQGKVVLRVTFKADSTIGAISVVSGLSDGLTERAIEAAKGIKFKPATRGGVPYSVTKPVEYTFTIY
jgi:TonB family protein